MSDFEPHSVKQDAALFSSKKITLCATGIQWGKTKVGAIRTKLLCHQYPDVGMNHIIVAPSYKILKQATLPGFFDIMKGLGEYKSVDAVFELHTGAKVWCRTGTDPDSIVGITDVYSIWGDEAGLFSYYFYQNIMGRSRTKSCPVTFTTSPYSYNWVARDIIEAHNSGRRDDIHLCQAASEENPYFPKKEFEAARLTMSKHDFDMMYGGLFLKRAGLVYDCFEEKINVVPSFDLPEGTKFYAGIDWGYTQPFACCIIAATPDHYFYVVSEVYETRLSINEIVDILRQRRQIWNIENFFAGPDQPGHIQELNKAGLRCQGADNNVKLGVDDVYKTIKSGHLKFFKNSSPNIIDEIDSYHWPSKKELDSDQDDKDPNPVKQNDHGLDALRYVMRSIINRAPDYKKSMKTPAEGRRKSLDDMSLQEKLKRLRKKSRPAHEIWS